MPRVQFSYPPRDISITKAMPSPARISQMDAWYKAARRVIPEIPDTEDSDWLITEQHATTQSIIWELHDSVGNKCAVTIDRKYSIFN